MGTDKRLLTICGAIAGAAAVSVAAGAFADDTNKRAGTPMVLAQAGSTGGTIGKQGKSAAGSSGTEERTDKSAQRAQRRPSLRSLAATTSAVPQYLGCFKDQGNWFVLSTEGRDLNGLAADDPGMTSERCVSICSSQGFIYAGTQYRTQCFCGNKYGRSGQADNCNMACGGNPSQKCGGVWANSVYRVSKIR